MRPRSRDFRVDHARRSVLLGMGAAAVAGAAQAIGPYSRRPKAVTAPPSGSPTSLRRSLTIGTNARRQLFSDTFPEILAVPTGNTITLTQVGGSGGIQPTLGRLFKSGDPAHAMPPPSAAYNGIEGSGYLDWFEAGVHRTAVPQSETRSTAMPVLRFVNVIQERFTGKYVVACVGDEEERLDHVDFSTEGAQVSVSNKTWVHYTDVNGIRRAGWAWACELDAANYLPFATDATRGVYVYARGIPKDATMQSQLINDFPERSQRLCLYPATKLFSCNLEVRPSAGANSFPMGVYPATEAIFTSLDQAINYAVGRSVSGHTCATPAQRVQITCMESGDYVMVNQSNTVTVDTTHLARGLTRVTHGPGVTMTMKGNGALWTPGSYGIEFAGNGLNWDVTNFIGFGTETSTADRFWFPMNGIGQVIADFDFYDHLTPAGNTAASHLGEGRDLRDCDYLYWTYLNQPTIQGRLIQGHAFNCTFRRLSISDIFDGAGVVYGCRVLTAGAKPFRINYPSIRLRYLGTGTATLVKSGTQGASNSSFVLQDNVGAQIGGTFTLANYPKYPDVVAALLADPAVAAVFAASSLVTTGDGVTDRPAITLCIPPLGDPIHNFVQGPFTTSLPSGVDVDMGSFFDIHMDVYQTFHGANPAPTNVVFQNNYIRDAWGIQPIFFDQTIFDALWDNYFIENNTSDPGAFVDTHDSQGFNVTVRNYSDPNTTTILGFGTTPFQDSYSRYNSNVIAQVTWALNGTTHQEVGSSTPVITDSLSFGAYITEAPQAPVNFVTSTGSAASTYPGMASGDIRPAGALLTVSSLQVANPQPFDVFGVMRPAFGTIGAKTAPDALTTIPAAKAEELALVGVTADSSTWVATYFDGPGDTGNQVTLTLDATVVEV